MNGRLHPDTIHISGHTAPPGVKETDPHRGCCYGDGLYDPTHCTCWEPIYDLEQADVIPGEPVTRSKCCHDCAYRRGSPEDEAGETEDLHDLAARENQVFFCHQGMRRAIAYRHPDGTVLPADEGDYRPPIVLGVAYRADGTPADRCGGWGALRTTRREEATT
jgi:hypothetical protein